ncbi:MAG: amino acid ABC transporter substrate-binding protein [Acidaminobacteraceae bacterium]
MKNLLKVLQLTVIMALVLVFTVACTSKEADTNEVADSNEAVAELNDYEKIVERGYIVLGLDDTFAPMGFRDADNELVGFDVDLAKEVFARLDIELRFQPIDWSMKETELNSGNIDMIWNGYTITDERMEKVLFSKPYIKNRQIIVTKYDSGIVTKADLEGKFVSAQSESSSVDAINKDTEFVALIKDNAPITFDTNNEAFLDLEAGRVDAVVADEILAMYYLSQKGAENYNVLAEDLGKEEYGIGFRKTSKEVVEAVDGALDSMREDGVMGEISKKWFAEDIINY